jgi:poly(A) polymerase
VEVSTFRRQPATGELPEDPEEHFNFVQNVFGSPREDAFRRDFTINALFYDIGSFAIVDHVGGMEDIESRRIRAIGEPSVRFREDPVRMLRALEFAARLDFELDPSIREGIARCAPLIASAAPARVREELQEFFRHQVAGKVLRKALDSGLLEHLLPGCQADDEGLNLLRRVDEQASSRELYNEAFTTAALFLSLFMADCPPASKLPLAEVLGQANRLISPYCRYFSVAKQLRHEARELLVGCYRLARGRGMRGEQRFLKNPYTPLALELFSLWGKDHPELTEQIAEWRQAVGETVRKPLAEKKKTRRPRRPSHRGHRARGRSGEKPRTNE